MKNPFKRSQKVATLQSLHYRSPYAEAIPKTPPPPSDRDRLREVLKTLDRLNCEYEIIYHNIKYTRKLNEHESH